LQADFRIATLPLLFELLLLWRERRNSGQFVRREQNTTAEPAPNHSTSHLIQSQ
jgi:hypothetical protein